MAHAPCGGAGRSLPAMRPLRQPTAASTKAAPARRAAAAIVLALMVCLGAGATRGAWAAAENPPPPTHPAAAQPGVASAPSAAATTGAAPSAAAQPSPLAKPQPAAAAQTDERVGVVDFLGETIAWYRQLETEERLAIEPAEALFVDDDRQMALQIARLAFQYARAKAALLKSEKAPAPPSDQAGVGGAPGKAGTMALPGLPGLAAKTRDNLKQLIQQAEQLKAESASAKAVRRPALARQLAIVQSQIELAQSRLDSYDAILQFQTTAISAGNQSAGLLGQIDALERGLPQLNASAKGAAAPAAAAQGAPPVAAAVRSVPEPATASDSGLLGTIEALFRLGREESALDGRIDDTRHLAALTNAARAPLIARLRDLNARADALAAQPGGDDLAANRARKQQFDRLIARHKTITDALIPLSKQGVVLQLYVANLQRWKGAVGQRSDNQLHLLVVRLSALGVVLLAIFVGAFIWRSLTFRYVQDLRRRRQLLQLRKLTVALVVGLVLLFDFASQLGTLATVMGLAAAGVALALQNVILSFASYFFVTGRYGIRVGDRIQISGISGDVIDVGLFKLTLMELVGDGNSRQPTGRVVVFPNSIVFQTNGNFFKQAPGTNFVWNEFRLTLSPECDYRLAEKRLLEVVEDVYARYRDTVQRQYSDLERDLSMKFESPRPQSRLRLGPNGIELTIRYPADTRYAVQVADEISRRALDAITQDPALSLSMPGTPNLSPLARPQPPIVEAAEPESGGEAAAASAMVPAGAEVTVQPPSNDPPVPQPRAPGKS
jgi:small-conductance mechanosensitive channel